MTGDFTYVCKFPVFKNQEIIYYSAPKSQKKLKDLNEVDPELLKTFEKLGISLNEQKRLANVAVDVVFDSVLKFIQTNYSLTQLRVMRSFRYLVSYKII